MLAKVPKANGEMVAAAIGAIFSQPDATHVHTQFDEITHMLGRQFPTVAAMLESARAELLAFCSFPQSHWRNACWIRDAVLIIGEDAGVPGMTPLAPALVASGFQCLPGDPRLAAVA